MVWTAEPQSAAHPCSQHVNYKGWQGEGRGDTGVDSAQPGHGQPGDVWGRGFCDGCCCPWGVQISVAPALSLLRAVKGLAQTFLVALRGSRDAVRGAFAG